MRTLFHKLFIENWQRKSISLLLGMVVWLLVNHSLTSTKVIPDVPVRIINLPPGKTIEGMQSNGRLNKKLNLTLIGNTDLLNSLLATDLEVIIDATGKPDEWGAPISKKNLVSLNPEVDVSKKISKVYHHSLIIRLTNLVTETIPVTIAPPIGEPPRGYQFLDVWPDQLSLTVSGPEDIIRRLKSKEQKITFNLNDISKAQLDNLVSTQKLNNSDVVSFFVPDQWKQINIPLLSDSPLDLIDVTENRLRIDFLRCALISLDFLMPVSLFFPQEYAEMYNPTTLSLQSNEFLCEKNNLFFLTPNLFATGCDRVFIQIIKNKVEIVFTVCPPDVDKFLEYSLIFVNPHELENQYVTTLMSSSLEEDSALTNPGMKEGDLRNRFRSYMNRFKLFIDNNTKLELRAFIQGNSIVVEQINSKLKPAWEAEK